MDFEDFEKEINKHEPTLEQQEEILNRTEHERLELECKRLNKTEKPVYNKEEYDCPICNNSGKVHTIKTDKYIGDDNIEHIIEYLTTSVCSCVRYRLYLNMLKYSGMSQLIKNSGFDKYETKNKWQESIKNKAEEFVTDENCTMFFIGGMTGAGKTIICSSIVNEYLKQLKEVKYIVWLDFMDELKGDMDRISQRIKELQNVEVLYIDELFKTSTTRFEIDTIYKIINYRYVNNKTTIISSECQLINNYKDEDFIKDSIANIDAAIAGRIYEKSGNGKYIINIPNKAEYNYRLNR